MKATEQEVYQMLEELAIPYEKLEHQAVFTVDEIDFKIDGTQVKNLLLRNGSGKKYYFVIAPEDQKIDLKALGQKIDSGRLSFASEKRLLDLLGLETGSVNPFALSHDTEKRVTVIIDANIDKDGNIGFHPNINTATLTITFKDLERYLQHFGYTPQYITF